eukprot:3788-Heterococcus_DN1.PRE.6
METLVPGWALDCVWSGHYAVKEQPTVHFFVMPHPTTASTAATGSVSGSGGSLAAGGSTSSSHSASSTTSKQAAQKQADAQAAAAAAAAAAHAAAMAQAVRLSASALMRIRRLHQLSMLIVVYLMHGRYCCAQIMAYMLTSKEFTVHLRAMGIYDTALMPDEVAQDTAATAASATSNSSSSASIGMSSEARAEQLIEVFPLPINFVTATARYPQTCVRRVCTVCMQVSLLVSYKES